MKNAFKSSASLTQVEIDIVKALAEQKGLNFSAALRVIVREWAETRKLVLDYTKTDWYKYQVPTLKEDLERHIRETKTRLENFPLENYPQPPTPSPELNDTLNTAEFWKKALGLEGRTDVIIDST